VTPNVDFSKLYAFNEILLAVSENGDLFEFKSHQFHRLKWLKNSHSIKVSKVHFLDED
jgi:hypothetical protein